MKEELEIEIVDVTHENAITLQRHEYYFDGNLVGHSEYDNQAGVFRGALVSGGKNVYAGSPQGIAWKIQAQIKKS
jgi:hypothetical protein